MEFHCSEFNFWGTIIPLELDIIYAFLIGFAVVVCRNQNKLFKFAYQPVYSAWHHKYICKISKQENVLSSPAERSAKSLEQLRKWLLLCD